MMGALIIASGEVKFEAKEAVGWNWECPKRAELELAGSGALSRAVNAANFLPLGCPQTVGV